MEVFAGFLCQHLCFISFNRDIDTVVVLLSPSCIGKPYVVYYMGNLQKKATDVNC